MVNELIKKLPTSLVIKGMQTEIPGQMQPQIHQND